MSREHQVALPQPTRSLWTSCRGRLAVYLRFAPLAALWLLLMALLSFLHQATVLAIATGLHTAASQRLFRNLLTTLGADPVYASVFNRTLGNIEAQGLAIGSPLGEVLHSLAPVLFRQPDHTARGAWVTGLVADGSSHLAMTITSAGAEILFVALGVGVLVAVWPGYGRGTRRRYSATLLFVSLFLQGRGLAGLLSLRLTLQDLEVMGLTHVFTKLLPLDVETYDRVVAQPLSVYAGSLLPLGLALTVHGTLLAAGILWARPWRPRSDGLSWSNRLFPRHLPVLLLVVAFLVGAILPQRLFPAFANYDYLSPTEAAVLTDDEAAYLPTPPANTSPAPTAAPTAAPAAALPPLSDPSGGLPVTAPKAVIAPPSQVTISGANYGYAYTVNGLAERIKGVGYNPRYAGLPREERSARYDRDFARMKAMGVNTILGWDQHEFDELTLEKAQEYGLGVVLPYHLPYGVDYDDPFLQAQIQLEVQDWVRRFRHLPALRMWGIGNEVIHSMGKNPNTPQARAFARFYASLADAVHAIDPDHPITYRDAEDVYLGPMREALQEDGRHRPWFVYGVNFFTFRICEALRDWPQRGLDVPLMVSEFAPSGLAGADRAKGYLRMWKCMGDNPSGVLGGFAYVWLVNGPEVIDRVMGLVDDQSQPVDGSLDLLGKAFHRQGTGRPVRLHGKYRGFVP